MLFLRHENWGEQDCLQSPTWSEGAGKWTGEETENMGGGEGMV